MVDLFLYRLRIGTFGQRLKIRKLRRLKDSWNPKLTKNVLKLLFGAIFSVLILHETTDNSSGGTCSGIVHINYKQAAKNIYPWKQVTETVEFRYFSKQETPNFKAKMLYGNIKRGIVNIHVNIRSLYNKMSEVKNLVLRE